MKSANIIDNKNEVNNNMNNNNQNNMNNNMPNNMNYNSNMNNNMPNNMNNNSNMNNNMPNNMNNNFFGNNTNNNMNIQMMNNMNNQMNNNMNNEMMNKFNNDMNKPMMNNLNNNMHNANNNTMNYNMPQNNMMNQNSNKNNMMNYNMLQNNMMNQNSNQNNMMNNNMPQNNMMNQNSNQNNMMNNMSNPLKNSESNKDNIMKNNTANNMPQNNISNNMSNNFMNNQNNNMANNMTQNNMSNNMSCPMVNNPNNNMNINMMKNNGINNGVNINLNNINNNFNMNNNMQSNNQNSNYAKVVIQALNLLNQFKNKLYLEESSNSDIMKDLTNCFKFLFSQLFGGMNEEYFRKIMNLYDQHMISINRMNNPEPYTFLYEMIKYLKEENQRQKIPPYKQNEILQKWLNERNNFDLCFKSFKSNTKEYDHSSICSSLYFSQLETYMCNKCGQYYFIHLLPMIEIDLNKFSKEGAPKYNLQNYLNSYFGNQSISVCKICNTRVNAQYKILTNSPTLIIHIYRDNPILNNKTEINLDINLNISNYIHRIENIGCNEKFILRGYIGYEEQIGYFLDYNFKIDNSNFIWIRYNNDKYTQINNQYLNNSKPILIFYEATDDKTANKKKSQPNNINIQPNISSNQRVQNTNQSMGNYNINNPAMNLNHINNTMPVNNNNMCNNMYNNNMNQQMQNNLFNSMQNQFGQMNPMMQTNSMSQQQIFQMNQQIIQQQQMIQNMNLMKQKNMQNQMNEILSQSKKVESANNPNTNKVNENNISINVFLVSESNQNDESSKLVMQITKDEKMNEIYKRYLGKLIKNDNYIKKFIFNGNEISKTSTQTATELKFTNECKIKAIKNEEQAK